MPAASRDAVSRVYPAENEPLTPLKVLAASFNQLCR
jgi:hypothetical protein